MHTLMTYLAATWAVIGPYVIATLVPMAVAAFVPWLFIHLKIKNAQAQALVTQLLTAAIQRGGVATQSAIGHKLAGVGDINTGHPEIDGPANYVAKMTPDLLKKAGIDITTPQGRDALAMRVAATPPPDLGPPQTVNVTETKAGA